MTKVKTVERDKALLIKASWGVNNSYRWFYTDENISQRAFTKKAKSFMSGFDRLRFVESKGFNS